MSSYANRLAFLQTLSAELIAQENRIRFLIGDRHWHTDGAHKEAILISLLSRYLPAGFVATRGFVINTHDENLCSKEQDILILDTRTERPLFLAGDVAVAFVEQTVASISVKTTLDKQTIRAASEGLESLRYVDQRPFSENQIWKAIFFYRIESEITNPERTVVDWIRQLADSHSNLGWNMLCLNPHLIVKSNAAPRSGTGELATSYRGYNCPGMAAAIMISSLLDVIAAFEPHTSSPSLSAALDSYTQDPII
jgi:hypothetical protein